MRKVRSLLNLDLDLSPLHSLRPCLGQGASLGEEAVLADSGRAGEVGAGVGRVRSLAFLSILQGCSRVVPHGGTIEDLVCQKSFPTNINFRRLAG